MKDIKIIEMQNFYQTIAGKPIDEQIDAARAKGLTITVCAGSQVHNIKPLMCQSKLWKFRKEHAIADWHYYTNGAIYLEGVKVYGKGAYRM